jgi:hypothetical protein
VIGLGISETEVVFAKKLLKNINIFNDSGVPLKMLSEVKCNCGFLKIIKLNLYTLYLQGSLQVPDIIDCDKITIASAFVTSTITNESLK